MKAMPMSLQSSVSLVGLALEICLTLDHPLIAMYPRLEDCPDMDAVYRELLRCKLAEAA